MEGKGWFVIYGILLLVVAGLVVGHFQQSGRLNALTVQVLDLKAALVTPLPEGTPAPAPSATPDLGTVEGRDGKRKADLAIIQKALESYRRDNANYPTEVREVIPKYLPSLPEDPMSPKFSYRYRRNGVGYILTCALESKNDSEDKSTDGKQDQIYTLTEQPSG